MIQRLYYITYVDHFSVDNWTKHFSNYYYFWPLLKWILIFKIGYPLKNVAHPITKKKNMYVLV